MRWYRRWWRRDEREDIESNAEGEVTFNHLQQSEPECIPDDCQPAVITTDPWGITEESGS